jgi:hypothetical protein
MTANKDMKNVEVVWWLSLSIVVWKCACHFTFGILKDCVENFSILDKKEIFQPNARFEFSHSFDFEDSVLLEGIHTSLAFGSHGTRVSRFSHPSRTSETFKMKA